MNTVPQQTLGKSAFEEGGCGQFACAAEAEEGLSREHEHGPASGEWVSARSPWARALRRPHGCVCQGLIPRGHRSGVEACA